MNRVLLIALITLHFTAVHAQTTINFQVNTTQNRTAISPYIYGMNAGAYVPVYGAAEKYRSFRLGGNRLTGYNWETNYSNAGLDYNFQNDDNLCNEFSLTAAGCSTPGEVAREFHRLSNVEGGYTLATVPIAGYVARDKNGPVSSAQNAPSFRFKQIQHIKGSAFTLNPDTTDAYVYTDEFINYLVTKLGTAATGGIRGYDLDNEPGLWNTTHREIHSAQTGAVEVLTANVAAAKAIKSVDPSAEVFGGVFYGFSDYYDVQGSPDWSGIQGSYAWYMDYFLDKMKQQSATYGKRLLDVFDFHYYPEATADGSTQVWKQGAVTAADKQARMQAPRTLWDPAYRENSWIGDWFSSYLPLIPRMQQSIDQYYPGTKLGISEWNFGGGEEISGGIAHADALGIFGAYGIYSAQMWTLWDLKNTYFQSAFRTYTNYDGAGHRFGDTHVYAHTSDSVKTSIWASVSGVADDTLHLIVINKTNGVINGNFILNTNYNKASVWQFAGASASINKVASNVTTNTTFTMSFPALSVSHVQLTKAMALPVTLLDIHLREVNRYPQLIWKTSNESDILRYEVERSDNGTDFRTVGIVDPKNVAQQTTYDLIDHTIPMIRGQMVYYRLKIIEQTGSHTYSKALPFQVKTMSVTLSPNPAHNEITVSGLSSSDLSVEIFDMAGRKVYQVNTNGAGTMNFAIDYLKAGIFLVRIINQFRRPQELRFVRTID